MDKLDMYENFDLLVNRVLTSLSKTDLLAVKHLLEEIKTPTLISGVGGSSVVSNFAAKVLSFKNGIIATNVEPRTMNYLNIKNYINVLCCSYSGNNYGVETSFNNDLVHYLLSSTKVDGVNNINYSISNDREYSFISLSSTLIPMSILLAYYLENDIKTIEEILYSSVDENIKNSDIYEIFTGYESSTAACYLDSTLTESGIALAILHDKYSYCHGRSTIARDNQTLRILLNTDTELDKVFLSELDNIYSIERKFTDDIINDYYLTYMCMLLSKQIAHLKNKDLSKVKYLPIVKKLYKYKGEM